MRLIFLALRHSYSHNRSRITIERTIHTQNNISKIIYSHISLQRIPQTCRQPTVLTTNPLIATLSSKLCFRCPLHHRLKIGFRVQITITRISCNPSAFQLMICIQLFRLPPRHIKVRVINLTPSNLLTILIQLISSAILPRTISLYTTSSSCQHHRLLPRSLSKLHNIPQLTIRQRMTLIHDHKTRVQTFLRIRFSRKHTPNRTCSRHFNNIPINVANSSKLRFTLNNLPGITKRNSCLLLLSCTRINFTTIITIKQKPQTQTCN